MNKHLAPTRPDKTAEKATTPADRNVSTTTLAWRRRR
jgi:hypothetical protein